MNLKTFVNNFKRFISSFVCLKCFIPKNNFQIPHYSLSQHLLTKLCKHIKNIIWTYLFEKGARNNDLWNFFGGDLDVQMRWYLDWGTFRAWKTFPEILVNRCWLNIDIEASVGQKWLKRQLFPKKVGPFCYVGLCAMIFGWEVAQRVYLSLRK